MTKKIEKIYLDKHEQIGTDPEFFLNMPEATQNYYIHGLLLSVATKLNELIEEFNNRSNNGVD